MPGASASDLKVVGLGLGMQGTTRSFILKIHLEALALLGRNWFDVQSHIYAFGIAYYQHRLYPSTV